MSVSPKPANPTDIARETLRQLAVRRISPTPDRYEELYFEISGEQRPKLKGPHPLIAELIDALKAMPRKTPELSRQISLVEQAALTAEWRSVPPLLVKAVELQGGQAELTITWADLIKELIAEWDKYSPNFNRDRKKESLSKVLLNFGGYANLLNEKLDALVKSWAEGASAAGDIATLADEATEAAAAETVGAKPDVAAATVVTAHSAPQPIVASDWQRWRGVLARTLQQSLLVRVAGKQELEEEAASLIQAASSVASDEGLSFLAERLEKFWMRLDLRSQHSERIERGLINLLVLLSENMLLLTGEDEWVKGQIEVVREILCQPLTMHKLYDAEVGFKEIVYRQGSLRSSLDEAQQTLKSMLSLFINRLGEMSNAAGGYHDKIAAYSGRIQQASDIADLKYVLDEMLHDTRSMQTDMARSRDEMAEAQSKAEAAERRIAELERELKAASEKIREDQLTGALNRRGFDDAYAAELARADRSGKSLCVAMLDIDNFKRLNDRLGHAAGDDALVHLVKVITDTLRPSDQVARYGGEEFVILLPETVLTEAASVMRRVQRELTKRFFLYNNERILITFSAGVTRHLPGEDKEEAIERADHAMYRAKKAGKNQVIVAEDL